MTPTPQEHATSGLSAGGHRVVISGMAGLYPKARNLNDLEHILYNKVNPISSEDLRWKYSHPEAAEYAGNVPDLDRFDAQFFKVHFRLANSMDSMSRKILEQTFEAIYDAGISPTELSGKKIGVYIGSCFSETEKACFYVASSRTGFGIAGCSKSMFANRISYWLNAKGPSMSIDEACCSSTRALEQAYQAISRGECEAAIVGGSYLCLHPQSSVHYGRIMTTSTDGKTRSFSHNAAGCAKSEAINVLFLQEAKYAKRVYADVVHVKSEFVAILNDETGPRFGFYRNPQDTATFLKKFYDEAGVLPNTVEYVEAFGSAVPEADKAELEAIDEVFCRDRKTPLLVGSVMSNIGYGEAASGISAVTKVLLGYHRSELAGNLHCDSPRQDVSALQEGRMRILTDNIRFQGSYTAVNSLSVTGVNAHVLIKSHYRAKNPDRYKTNLPRLVTISARQECSVKKVLDYLKSKPIDAEELALLHNIHKTSISGHMGRGFTILDSKNNQTISLTEKAEYFDDVNRPLWFVYSGMGSQWAGMGAQLMRIPIFAAAIQRCHHVLEPKGINIIDIITSTDKNIFNNILHSFVGIAAVQIGLTDVLFSLGLVPDKIIGHSVGELGCAYADGCVTAEEMILAAYYRGLVSLETPFIRGSMAAVGVGYQQMSKMCPPDIEIACHNSSESCTISGPADAMRTFVAELTSKGIFGKEVPCSNIAYHSRYIAEAGPGLRKYLKQVILTPKARSERWVSTSIPQDRWNEPLAKYSSADYHTNNLLSPVLFEETSRLIPSSAVLVEVAPHGLLQAILKRSLPPSCTNIPLTRRAHPDNVLLLLQAVGELYIKGYNPKVHALYPQIEFPVSTGTPILSHLVEWAHEENWPLPLYQSAHRNIASSRKVLVSVHEEEYKYLRGHVSRGKTLLPFSFALLATWDTLAMSMFVPKKSMNVEFRDVTLYTQPIINEQKTVRLSIAIHRGTGWFEVMNESSKVATGFINIFAKKNISVPDKIRQDNEELKNDDTFTIADIYRVFQERQYDYSGAFRSIQSANNCLSEANILWEENWVTFLDGLFQINTLKHTTYSGVSQLDRIGRIIIDIDNLNRSVQSHRCSSNSSLVFRAKLIDIYNRTQCEGIILENLQFRDLPPLRNLITIERQKNVPRGCSDMGECWGDDDSSPLDKLSLKYGNLKLKCGRVGHLDSLQWVPESVQPQTGNLVKVHYVGINIEDVKKALGIVHASQNTKKTSNCFGMEFSGITERGERVMGIASQGAASGEVIAQPELMWPVPPHWSLEEAATVPYAYMCAYYCLVVKTTIKLKTKAQQYVVLVHGGAGALGQAVIQVALSKGYRVLTTVSDLEKKRFLMRLYLELREEDIGSSRDASFSDVFLSATNGKGCNLVIFCLKNHLRDVSLKCCGDYSLFIDLMQIPNNDSYNFGMNNLNNDTSYVTLDLPSLLRNSKSNEVEMLHRLVSEGIAVGEVRPLSRVTYSAREAPRAFRLLAASRHRGRVLLRLHHHDDATNPKTFPTANRIELVICDEQPLGLQLTDELINSGKTRIHLHFENQPSHLHLKHNIWKKMPVQITTSQGYLRDMKDISNLFRDVMCLGSIEGLYLTSESLIEPFKENQFELSISQFCPNLKNYLILERIYRSIKIDKRPMIVLDLSQLESFQDEAGLTWYRGAREAIQQALWSPEGTVVARPHRSGGLVQQVAKIAGVNVISKDMSTDLATKSLEDLGMLLETSAAVSAFLRDEHNTYIDEEAIPALTIQRIQEIEARITKNNFTETKGLRTFYSFVDSDELLATTETVFLPTLTHNTNERDDEFNVNESFLCIVPGVEGHHGRFRALCEHLKLPALALQPGLDRPADSPRQLATRYAQVLLKKTGIQKSNKPFYILGYEVGVIVALELAAILEEHGLTGTVFCIGDGPDEVIDMVKDELRSFGSEEELQAGVVRHMFALMAAGAAAPAAVDRRGSWEARVDASVRALLGRVPHSAQYARMLMEAAYARINAVRRHRVIPRMLRSQIVLLHARSLSGEQKSCSLQQFTQRPLLIRELTAPMGHAATDLEVPAIINSCLDKHTLENFNKRNLCDTYLLNAEAFMSSVKSKNK